MPRAARIVLPFRIYWGGDVPGKIGKRAIQVRQLKCPDQYLS